MIKKIINYIKNRVKSYIRGVASEQLKHPFEIGNPLVKIGSGASISDDSTFDSNVSVGNNCFLSNVKVGSYSYLSFNVSVINTNIGKYCSIAQGVGICLGSHPSDTFVSTSPVFFSPSKQCGTTFSDKSYYAEIGNCEIGNDVWIGANAVIMDNVTVGDGAIIGAGCIVTKDVPPYAIVVGMPGKVIKYRFSEADITFLLNLKWWDKDDAWIKTNYKSFHDIKLLKSLVIQ